VIFQFFLNEPKFQRNGSYTCLQPFSGRILDAMSATGLRTCRYALEIPHVEEVVGNDYDAAACAAIRLNAEANGVKDKLTVTNEDAR
jgi:tRNA (guanine26-N2/guanine27-N2)-dimethyltransferase